MFFFFEILARQKMYFQKMHAHRAHVYVTYIHIWLASQMADRHSENSRTQNEWPHPATFSD